jgi:hypothetical protein
VSAVFSKIKSLSFLITVIEHSNISIYFAPEDSFVLSGKIFSGNMFFNKSPIIPPLVTIKKLPLLFEFLAMSHKTDSNR